MPDSSYIKLLQGIWNSIYRNTALRSFRTGINSTTGGQDFDISLSNESFPLEDDMPGLDESPAILIIPSDPAKPEPVQHRMYQETFGYKVRIWIMPATPDQAFRFYELVKLALLDGHNSNYVDASSPGLGYPTGNVQFSTFDPDGDMKLLTDEDDRVWWRADFRITVTWRYNLDSV